MKKIMLGLIFLLALSLAFASAPVVSNVRVYTSFGRIYVTYDLASSEACQVILAISIDGGQNFDVLPTALSGDFGEYVSPGTGKAIVWTPASDGMMIGGTYMVRVIARQNPVGAVDQVQSFVYVPGGTFHNGVSDVTISPLYVDKYEITQAEYTVVMGFNPTQNYGMGAAHPVYYVSWFHAIEYCNRRSLQQGLTPCYSYGSHGTNPADWPESWNYFGSNHEQITCNWDADGYRLLTEMEWLYVARGGNLSQGYAYSGGNNPDALAWHSGNAGDTTHEVGTKTANELGIFDMNGNVWEWIWDIYGPLPGTAQTNPRGAASGDNRMLKGGSWQNPAEHGLLSDRSEGMNPAYTYPIFGFRIARALKVATPYISLPSGTYVGPQYVSLSCNTSGADIRYTLDGTEPHDSSPLYSGVLTISTGTILKAKAFKDIWDSSNIATEVYSIAVGTPTVNQPFFSPVGGSYATPISVSLICMTPGAEIRYTTDGTDPTETSVLYGAPIEVNGTRTIKARAFKSGWNASPVNSSTYNFTGITVAAPVINPTPIDGIYTEPLFVNISCPIPGALIRYRTDGEEPDMSSQVYNMPFFVFGNTTVVAKAFLPGWAPSAATTAHYNFGSTVANPSFSPVQGVYHGNKQISITCSPSDASIYYTLDGSEPTQSSTLYTDPILLTENTVVKARGFKPGWNSSLVATATYTIIHPVADPVFSPPPGEYSYPIDVSISCATSGARIRYTTGGYEPTIASESYSSPIPIAATTTFKAKGYKAGMSESATVTAVYLIDYKVPDPVMDPPGGSFTEAVDVSISCPWSPAEIRYTLDGSEPTQSSPLYSSPLRIETDTTVRARGFYPDWPPSEIVTEVYSFGAPGYMVYVPGGTFIMGNADDTFPSFAYPTVTVTLSPFLIGRYEITRADWAVYMPALSVPSWPPGLVVTPEHPAYNVSWDGPPIVNVTWYGAIAYCNYRSIAEGFTPAYTVNGSTNPDLWPSHDTWMDFDNLWSSLQWNRSANGYRLPTEAEWEYAARGGTNDPDYTYAGSNNAGFVGWHRDLSGPYTDDPGPKPVGQLDPNGLGIYDMSGNVYEWCWDYYAPDYEHYGGSVTNPAGPGYTGEDYGAWHYRSRRGGSWDARSWELAVYWRDPYPDNNNHTGFRICRNAD